MQMDRVTRWSLKVPIVMALMVATVCDGSGLWAQPAKSGIYVNQQAGYQELSQMVRVPSICSVDPGCRYLAGTVRTQEHGYSKALLLKLGPDNRELWSLAIGTKDNFGIINSVAVDKDGSVIVAGKGSFEFSAPMPGKKIEAGIVCSPAPRHYQPVLAVETNFAKSYWVARISAEGQVLAAKSFEEPSIAQDADPRNADSEPSISVKQVLFDPNGGFWLVGEVSGRWRGQDKLATLSQGPSDLYCIKFSHQLEPLERRQWGRRSRLKADVVRWTGPNQLSIFGRVLQPSKPGASEMGSSPSQACQWVWDLGQPRELAAQVSEDQIGEMAVNARVLDYCQTGEQQLLLREGRDAQIYLDHRSTKNDPWSLLSKIPFGANAIAPSRDGLWLVGFGQLKGARSLGGCDIALACVDGEGRLSHPHLLGSAERDYATQADFDPSSNQLWIGATTEGALGDFPAPPRNTSKLVAFSADLNSLKNGPLIALGEEPPGPIRFKDLPTGATFWSEERPGFEHLVGLVSGKSPRLIGTREVTRSGSPKSGGQDTPFVAALGGGSPRELWEHQLAPAPLTTLEPLISLCAASWPDSGLLLACREFQAKAGGFRQGISLYSLNSGVDKIGSEHLKLSSQSIPASLSSSASGSQAFLVGQVAGTGQLWRLSKTGGLLESFPVKGFPHQIDAHRSEGLAITGSDNFSSFGENWLEIRSPNGQPRHRLSLGQFRVTSILCNENGPLLYGNSGDHLGLAQYVWAGRLAWTRTFGLKGRQVATHLRASLDGGYWLCGATNEAFQSCKGQGGLDALLLKVDSFGMQRAAQQFGSRYSETLVDVLETPQGTWLAGEIETADYTSDLWTLLLPK
jgi:hypothetical protein